MLVLSVSIKWANFGSDMKTENRQENGRLGSSESLDHTIFAQNFRANPTVTMACAKLIVLKTVLLPHGTGEVQHGASYTVHLHESRTAGDYDPLRVTSDDAPWCLHATNSRAGPPFGIVTA